MSEFTVFAVNFYRFDCVMVGVIVADAAPPIQSVIELILTREQTIHPITSIADICIDFMSPTERLQNLCISSKLILQIADRPAVVECLQRNLHNAILAILVDSPTSDNYFVVETKRELLCSDPPLTGI